MPTCSPSESARAETEVALRTAFMGGFAGRRGRDRQTLRRCGRGAPATASVPKTILTPRARARRRDVFGGGDAGGNGFELRVGKGVGIVVVEIVVEDEKVGVKVGALFDHELQGFVFEKGAVLDGGAAGAHGIACAGVADGVDDGAEALGLGFRTDGFYLLVGHGLAATSAEASGGEELDDVGAVGFGFADEGAEFIGRVDVVAVLAEDLDEGGEDARACSTPSRMRSRTGPSYLEPTLSTVVKPPWSVSQESTSS